MGMMTLTAVAMITTTTMVDRLCTGSDTVAAGVKTTSTTTIAATTTTTTTKNANDDGGRQTYAHYLGSDIFPFLF